MAGIPGKARENKKMPFGEKMTLPHDMVIISFMLFGKKHDAVIFMNRSLKRP